MKYLKIFEEFDYKSLKVDELKGLIVKRIYPNYASNGGAIVETNKGTFDVGCMGGAMISIEGNLDYKTVINKTIVDAIQEECSLTLIFDDGEVCFVDDTGGEGVDAGWIDNREDIFNETYIPVDKSSFIKKSIDESLMDGDLNRLKSIYKGLPENWENNYLISKLEEWLNN